MSSRRQFSRGLRTTVVLSAILLLGIAACAFSYGYANRSALDFEARIQAAKTAVAADTKTLQDGLATLSHLETLSEAQALHLAELAMQHPGPRGTRIVALELKKHSRAAASVEDAKLASLDGLLKAHRKASSRHRVALTTLQNQYDDMLRSAWLGRWARLADYPKLNAKRASLLTAPGASSPIHQPV